MNKMLLCLWAFAVVCSSAFGQNEKLVIAFGSCDDQERPQDMWAEVVAQHPRLWIWGGDNIYSDFKKPEARKALYEKQKSNPDYQKLIASCLVTGTWDDHDYGVNDGGKNYGRKNEAQLLAMQFIGFEKKNPVWARQGIYNSMEYGKGSEKVKVINLDTRSFRDTIYRENYIDTLTGKKMNRYLRNPTGDVLGEQQWAWLETELKTTDAQVVIVNSSIQVLPTAQRFEKWDNLPRARQRLLDLIDKTGKNILLISGDRHIAEFSKIKLPSGKSLFEFTSSGLTHTWSEPWKEENELRVGPLVIERNFGIIEVDWSNKHPKITMKVVGLQQKVFNELSFSFEKK